MFKESKKTIAVLLAYNQGLWIELNMSGVWYMNLKIMNMNMNK